MQKEGIKPNLTKSLTAVSMLRYGAFHLIPYFPRTTLGVPITKIVDSEILDMMSDEEDTKIEADKGTLKRRTLQTWRSRQSWHSADFRHYL